jgi:hypothetical protein
MDMQAMRRHSHPINRGEAGMNKALFERMSEAQSHSPETLAMDDLKERLRARRVPVMASAGLYEYKVNERPDSLCTEAATYIEALEQRVSELEEALTRISTMSDAEHPQREARRALMTSEWRPIETAPKDGSEFDAWAVWLDTGKGERVPNVHWGRGYIAFESERGELEGWLAAEWGIDGCEGLMDPQDQRLTHWQPLPAPPKPATNR